LKYAPSIDYVSASGRLWLLHRSRPDIHFKLEAGVQQELRPVQYRNGAVEDGPHGVSRLWREGWSAASIKLAGA